jgi:hypothetical protein|tara:strand:+ start:1711 stop:2055 length:345 start_codon:yes stop_codon:yes gene_type:complete
MSVGAIGAVGGGSYANPSQSAASGQKTADISQSTGGANTSGPIKESDPVQSGRSTSDLSNNMSTRDFVSLTEQVSKGGNETKDIMDMMKMIVALQIMQKTMEATGKIIDSFIKG